eukprot:m51a1_g6033 hypothetical protein (195) ;mRNA; f:146651-147381
MSTTSFLLVMLALVACAIAQFDCVLYGHRVAVKSTITGFYLTATGGKSASPAEAVVLRITPINPWRMGQPLLKGDNFLLLNGSVALRRTTVIGSDLSEYGSMMFALGFGQANLTTQTAQISSTSSMSAIGSPVSFSETIGVTLGGLAQGGVSTQQNPENSNRRYITIPDAAGCPNVVADWWRGWEFLRFIPVQP